MPLTSLPVQRWTEELSETRGVSFQNKFEKLVHLVGFIIRKFVMMHGHMNVTKSYISSATIGVFILCMFYTYS
jgi:hypothetical protein